MRTELEQKDIQIIVHEVHLSLKPYLVCKCNGKSDDVIFDVKGLAEYLKVSRKWIYERTHLKEIPHYKEKGLVRFRKSRIDKWLESSNVPAVNARPRL